MTTLLVRGNGKTGLPLAGMLRASSIPFLLTSRTGKCLNPEFTPQTVKFDYSDPSTYTLPFSAAAEQGLPKIDKMYLIGPPGLDVLQPAKAFIDIAVKEGVKRIVTVSASGLEKGGKAMGQVHEYLDGLDGIWYAVLRPTWFIENLGGIYTDTILSSDTIYSACGDGRLPFVSAVDMAQAAYDGLFSTDETVWKRGRAPRLVGPEGLTYDEVAQILTEVLGRTITHTRREAGAPRPEWDAAGRPRNYQLLLESSEIKASKGEHEAYLTDPAIDKIIGKNTMRDWVEKNKAKWEKQ